MAGRSFTSPSGAPPRMKTGHILPKIKKQPHHGHGSPNEEAPVDPLRHASSRISNFVTRHNNTSNKHGFHTKPGRPPAGRLAQRAGKPNRGSGKEHRALL